MGATFWTDEVTDHAVALWKGGKSASEVSRAIKVKFGLTFTRNAVIGKMHRLGLSGPGYGSARNIVSSDAVRRVRARMSRPKVVKPPKEPRPPREAPVRIPPVEVLSPNARPWEDRAAGQCAWPLGEAGAIRSCCNPVADGRAYCEGHVAVGFVPSVTNSVQSLRNVLTESNRHDRIDLAVRTGPGQPRPSTVWDEGRAA